MNLRLCLTLTACGMAAAFSGCSTPGNMFRGQSPDTTVSTVPAGWNPQHHAGPVSMMHEHAYQGTPTESYHGAIGPWSPVVTGPDGQTYYNDGAGGGPGWAGRMSPKREQRMVSKGLIPPPGSPYASGYAPSPHVDPNARPDNVINGVNVYNAGMYGRQVSAPPPGTPCSACRNGQYDLAPGGCPHCGADHIRWAPTHYQTYSYNRPKNLVYPSQNSVGGAAVYSYYTLKGPGDFFRDADGVY